MDPIRKILVVVLLLTGFAGGTVFMYLAFQGPRSLPQHATLLPQALPLPPSSLRDHTNAAFDNASLHGHWSLAFFGFTNCPDICPATLTQLKLARERVLHDGRSEFPEILLISVDPERDTPDVMAAYVERFGEGVTGLTGTIEEISKLTSTLGIYFHKSTAPGGHHNVDHSAAVMLINKSGEMNALFGAPHNIEFFVNDIPLITESG